MPDETVGAKVKRLRLAKGWSQTKLAEGAGIGQSTVVDIEKDKRTRPQSLYAVAAALGVTTEALLGSVPHEIIKPQTKFGFLTIKGEVSAGLWRSVLSDGDFDERDFYQDSAIPLDRRYPPDALFGLVVRGNSVNKSARDGDIAVCLDIWRSHRPVQHGDMVVAIRERGMEHETTIKRVWWHDSGLALFPESSDPEFDNEAPIPMEGDPGTDTRVIAFVLNFVRPATRL